MQQDPPHELFHVIMRAGRWREILPDPCGPAGQAVTGPCWAWAQVLLTFLELGEHLSLLLLVTECKGNFISPQLHLQALTFIFSSQIVPAASLPLQKAECSAHPKCS